MNGVLCFCNLLFREPLEAFQPMILVSFGHERELGAGRRDFKWGAEVLLADGAR